MKSGRYSALLPVLFLILFLSGCATHNIRSTSLDSSKPFNQENGVVAVQVVNNTGRLSKFIENWTEVIVTRIDNFEALKEQAREALKAKGDVVPEDEELDWKPDVYTLESRDSGLAGSRIFIGEMPEGEYIVNNLWSYFDNGQLTAYLSMPVGYSAGTFTVEKSSFTDLGTLIFQPLLNIKKESFWGTQSELRAYVARSSEILELGQLVKQVYPNLQEYIDFSNALTWKADNIDTFRKKVVELSFENLYGNHFVSLAHHGRAVQLTRLGRVRVLDQDGKWSQVVLPTRAELLTALDTQNHIAFAGERGLLLTSESLNGEWKMSQPVGSDQSILWLGKGDSYFFAMTNNGDTHNVYKFESLGSTWQLIKSHKRISRFFTATGGVFPIITNRGALRLFIDDKMWDYDAALDSWSIAGGRKLLKLSQLSGSNLSGLEVSSWDGVGQQTVSFDEGSNWKNVGRNLVSTTNEDRFADTSLAAITEAGKVISVDRPSLKNASFELTSSVEKNTNPLQIVTIQKNKMDEDDQWQFHGKVENECAAIIPELTSVLSIYALCDNGQVVVSKNHGKNWETDIEVDIASMQAGFDLLVQELKADAK